jgi:hypothetical protein
VQVRQVCSPVFLQCDFLICNVLCRLQRGCMGFRSGDSFGRCVKRRPGPGMYRMWLLTHKINIVYAQAVPSIRTPGVKNANRFHLVCFALLLPTLRCCPQPLEDRYTLFMVATLLRQGQHASLRLIRTVPNTSAPKPCDTRTR